MSQNILILEDCPNRIRKFRQHFVGHNMVIHDTADAFKVALVSGPVWDLVMLDHDLGGQVYVDTTDTNTGSEVVRFMVDPVNNVKSFITTATPAIIVHSLNIGAAEAMTYDLDRAGFSVKRIPFTSLRLT